MEPVEQLTDPRPHGRLAVWAEMKRSRTIRALATGLVCTVVYGGFEFHHFGVPDKLSLFGSTDTLSVFHYPLIWLLLSVMFFGAFYAMDAVRGHRVRGHRVAFCLSVLGTLLILVFYARPLVGKLTVPANDTATCSAPTKPTTNPVVIHYSTSGFCPVRVTVSSGTTVRFIAANGVSMRIDSDYAGLTQKQAGDEFSATMTNQGTFLYTDSASAGSSVRKFFDELLGQTETHQGVVKVVNAKSSHRP